MVAYESFDTGSGYKHEDQKTQFSDAVDRYNSNYDDYMQQLSGASDDLKNVIKLSGGAKDDTGTLAAQYQNPNYISQNNTSDSDGTEPTKDKGEPLWKEKKATAERLYKNNLNEINSQNVNNLLKELKTLKRISKYNISSVSNDNSSLRDSIADEEVDGMGDADTSDPRNWKQISGDNYESSLENARKEEQKKLNEIGVHYGEYHDAKLQRKSYHLHSIIFSIIFVVVVGLIIRAALTNKSDAIETIILFLGIALALYYLIEYIF